MHRPGLPPALEAHSLVPARQRDGFLDDAHTLAALLKAALGARVAAGGVHAVAVSHTADALVVRVINMAAPAHRQGTSRAATWACLRACA